MNYQPSFFVLIYFLLISNFLSAQNTVGLLQSDSGSHPDGYLIMGPIGVNEAYLIDKCGNKVKSWNSQNTPGLTTILAPDGNVLRLGYTPNNFIDAGGIGGLIEKIDWNGNLLWNYRISDSTQSIHHDIIGLENGNVLVFAWEVISRDEAVNQGRNPDRVTPTLYSEKIMEIQPVGSDSGLVVWEWRVWDHLIQSYDNSKLNFGPISSNPQLIDINFKSSATNPDWIHFNSIDYNYDLDQILVSCHNFNELWIIDHSTTTAEAAGHTGGNSGKGGDLLYRWGNPQAYNVDSSSYLFGQHDAHWIKNGMPFANQIMVFNNGNGRTGGNYSTVEIINPPSNGFLYDTALPYLPASPSWIYNANNEYNFYVAAVSSAEILPNSHVIITDGLKGTIFEIDSSGNTLWTYVNPAARPGILNQGQAAIQNQLFTTNYYPSDFPGFTGRSFDPISLIENINLLSDSCNGLVDAQDIFTAPDLELFPNPSKGIIHLRSTGLSAEANFSLVDVQGSKVFESKVNPIITSTIDLSSLSKGLYLVRISSNGNDFSQRLLLE